MQNDPSSRLEALLRQGSALHAQDRLDAAQALYSEAAQVNPSDFRAWYLLGIVALQRQRPGEALQFLDEAVRANPRSVEAHIERGNAFARLNQIEAAIEGYSRAIEIAPNQPIARYNRGNMLRALRQYESALADFDNVIALRPDHAAALTKRGDSLYELGRHDAALDSYERAIALRPDYRAFSGRGNAQYKLARYDAAAESFKQAIQLKPDDADAHNNRGNALYRVNQHAAALGCYDTAIAIDPGYAGAHFNRGKLRNELKQYEAAVDDYERALMLGSDSRSLHGMRLQTKLQLCDWRGIDEDIARLAADLDAGRAAPSPFTVLVISGDPALQRKAAEAWVREEFPPNPGAAPNSARGARLIRIGYFSADFHNHATSHLMAGLLEVHDRSKFEVTLFSYGPDSQDDMRGRLESACDRFIEVREQSDEDVVRVARDLQIDIGIDLKGFTHHGRPGIFAARCAPVQVSFLGYPGTMGAPYMDYLVADATVIPASCRRHYTEKIIYLPASYQVNDRKRRMAEAAPDRQELGLPPTGFVYCCFNNCYKITPSSFDTWMRLLARVEGSVLWLLEDNPSAVENLRREAQHRQVDGRRLIFAKRVAPAEHLARHRAADLFLDTAPCNAHTTASDALWAGLPVLTCLTDAFAGRVAASLLNALQLPQLITADQTEYEELAVKLATQPQVLAEIAQTLAHNRTRSALFDTRRFAAQLELAYAQILDRHRAGLVPVDLTISADIASAAEPPPIRPAT